MNPFWAAELRRNWPLFGAIAIFIVFTASDQLLFQPAARRYQSAVKQATDLGMPIEPAAPTPVLPPRLFALLTDNALPAAAAQEQGNSGELTATFLEDLTALFNRHGMQLIGTEPGPVSQQSNSVQVRAHVRLRCKYADYLALLEDLAHSNKLISVDRFLYTTDDAGTPVLEMWVSRYVIKQTQGRR